VTLYRFEVAIFAIAFAVFGLVALALVWTGDWAYAGLANLNGVKQTSFLIAPSALDQRRLETPLDLQTVISWHHAWAAYVTGASSVPAISFGPDPIFTADESAHMADVRSVFRGAEIVALLALFVAAVRVARARRRGGALRLIRAGALTAVAIVGVIGLAAAVAFEPLFLLFHQVFFPQGNFLFAPDSNLIRLYPEWYWQGITAGVAVSFIAVALLAVGAAHIALRRRSNTYTRAA
jgi:integral membrane protein (TIGR01906 family)